MAALVFVARLGDIASTYLATPRFDTGGKPDRASAGLAVRAADAAARIGALLQHGRAWLASDSKRRRVLGAHDVGLFFWLTWPLTMPWYTVRTRARAGWRLAAQLYVLALGGQLGFIVGRTLRFFLSNDP